MGKGKIKSTRQYQPVKFGERFNPASVDGHRLAVKRARQALDCGPSVRCLSEPIHHGHQWKHCAWNKKSDGSASGFGNPKGKTIAQDFGKTRIKPCMARPVKHEQSFRHQVIGPNRIMQVKDATSGRNACIS